MKPRIYVDISVFEARGDTHLRAASHQFLDLFTRGQAIMLISDLTRRELETLSPAGEQSIKNIAAENIETVLLNNAACQLAVIYMSPDGNREHYALDDMEDISNWPPLIRLVNILLAKAVSDGASDVTIEPCPPMMRISFRVGSDVREIPPPPANLFEQILRRLKLMAGMNILETRNPQEGAIFFYFDKREFEFQARTYMTEHGEAITLSIAEKPMIDTAAILQNPSEHKEFVAAIHIALASIAKADYFVTCNSLQTNPDRIPIYNYANLKRGLPKIYVRTPKELNNQPKL